MNEEEHIKLVAEELRAAPPIHFFLGAAGAYFLAALLQLACRHRSISDEHLKVARKFVDQVGEIGPAVRESLALGWNEDNDR